MYSYGKEFVDPNGSCRTPREYPYSYSSHYMWGAGCTKDSEIVYHDRMQQWDGDKFWKAHKKCTEKSRPARHGSGRFQLHTLNKKELSILLTEYFEEPVEAVALGNSCNQSSGYPIYIFWFKRLSNEET